MKSSDKELNIYKIGKYW